MPFLLRSDYLNDLMAELKKNIAQKFEEISLSLFINLFLNENDGKGYEKDDFKFLIRFMANIEAFHDKLIENIILHSSSKNNVILDSFAGSGTTALSCIKTNRKYICIEKEKKYVDIINERIKLENEQLKLAF